LQLAARCHVGLSWRSPALDGSLELSTKLLDYGALGLPVVCNPTAMHRRLLGADYPLFAVSEGDVADAVARAAGDPKLWAAAAAAVRRLAGDYSGTATAERVSAELGAVFGGTGDVA
jgi:glycosyltransferase involved in cell wall biosynthesis